MSKVDVVVYVHPQLPGQQRSKIERAVMDLVGVTAASFDTHKHPHALNVAYEPEIVRSTQILEAVRQHDPEASLVGL